MIYLSFLRSEKDKVFEELVTLNDLRFREAFKSIYHAFLGNTEGPGYQEGVKNFFQACEDMGRQISPKMLYHYLRLNFLSSNSSAVRDKHGERLYQDITKMERIYQSNCK